MLSRSKTISRPFLLVSVVAALMLAACTESQNAEDSSTAAPSSDTAGAAMDTTSASASRAKVNLNDATREDFLALPEVGERMAHEFEEYRPYASIREFRREIGKYVDEEQVTAYEQYVFVPVRPNESDAQTLQQLPGISASEAEEIIAGRPYNAPDDFMQKIESYLNAGQRATAESYLAAPAPGE